MKAGRVRYNANTWTDWDSRWTPIAHDGLGDAVIVNGDGLVCVVPHDTGGDGAPSVVSADTAQLLGLMRELRSLPQYPKDGKLQGAYSPDMTLAELREFKGRLGALRRLAPRWCKSFFDDEIESVAEAISDLRFQASKFGQFLKVCEDFAKKCYKELRIDEKYASAYISPYRNKRRLRAFGWLKDGETPEEVRNVVERNDPPFPVDYGPFRPDE